ncbi:MAG: NAD-dependent epimerase/dehydratase family protein [Ignavibacteriales bacterium]|nr:NAD-dependent epimerase/dehydratase family protein [Ignavibacteriales bacterium]
MKILVTGGAGFIGSNIVEHFHQTDEVVVLDNLRSGFERNLAPFRVTFIHGSVTDRSAVEQAARGVDYIFHLAAMVSVPESVENPRETVDINVHGTLNVLEAARTHGVKKVVISSSAAIYGDNPVVPKVESMIPEPKSPYAVTKLDAEYYAKMYTNEFATPVVCLRYFNVFGPRQNPKSQYAAAVPIIIDKALRNQDITIYGDGEQTRDFVFVKDVVAANVLAARSAATGVYNIACGGRITINDLAKTIIALTKSSSAIVYAAERAGDVKHSQADIGRAVGIGFQPKYTLETGLNPTIEYLTSKL